MKKWKFLLTTPIVLGATSMPLVGMTSCKSLTNAVFSNVEAVDKTLNGGGVVFQNGKNTGLKAMPAPSWEPFVVIYHANCYTSNKINDSSKVNVDSSQIHWSSNPTNDNRVEVISDVNKAREKGVQLTKGDVLIFAPSNVADNNMDKPFTIAFNLHVDSQANKQNGFSNHIVLDIQFGKVNEIVWAGDTPSPDLDLKEVTGNVKYKLAVHYKGQLPQKYLAIKFDYELDDNDNGKATVHHVELEKDGIVTSNLSWNYTGINDFQTNLTITATSVADSSIQWKKTATITFRETDEITLSGDNNISGWYKGPSSLESYSKEYTCTLSGESVIYEKIKYTIDDILGENTPDVTISGDGTSTCTIEYKSNLLSKHYAFLLVATDYDDNGNVKLTTNKRIDLSMYCDADGISISGTGSDGTYTCIPIPKYLNGGICDPAAMDWPFSLSVENFGGLRGYWKKEDVGFTCVLTMWYDEGSGLGRTRITGDAIASYQNKENEDKTYSNSIHVNWSASNYE